MSFSKSLQSMKFMQRGKAEVEKKKKEKEKQRKMKQAISKLDIQEEEMYYYQREDVQVLPLYPRTARFSFGQYNQEVEKIWNKEEGDKKGKVVENSTQWSAVDRREKERKTQVKYEPKRKNPFRQDPLLRKRRKVEKKHW